MILDFDYVYDKYNLNVSGLLHIGGHYGGELQKYKSHNIDNIVLFEPLSSNFSVLSEAVKNIGGNVVAHQVALGNDNRKVTMNISSNEAQSSSILTPKVHLTAHPEVSFSGTEEVEMKKLDDYDYKDYNMIVVDVQGYELEVLKGASQTLHNIDYIYCEVNRDEVYEGNARVEEIDEFLSTYGFKRVETQWYYTEVWGDALYMKEKKSNPNVSLICVCKNRLESLRVSLSSWLLFDPIKEIIIVDWDSEEPIHDLTQLDPRIKVIRANNKKYFNLAQPLNLAASQATGDYILKVDTDYIINPYYNFFESYSVDETCFVSGAHDSPDLVYGPDQNGEYTIDMAKNEFMNVVDYVNCFSQYFRYLRGMLYVSRENFLKVNGYNESIDTYGFEDGDIETKLKSLGLTHKKISYDHSLIHIPHSDKKRIENCKYDLYDEREIRSNLSNYYNGDVLDAQTYYGVVSRLVQKNGDASRRKGRKITWKINQIDDQNYVAEDTIMLKLKEFPSVNYVSLEESIDRQITLVNQFYEHGITNINSVISKRFVESNDVVTGRSVHTLNDGTKGCVVSHLKAIKNWYENTDEDYGFFCEDDLSLETIQYWNFTWQEFVEKIPEDAECVQLLTIRGDFETFELRERQWNDWAATAYIITRDYAEILIDTYIQNDTYHLEVPNSEVMPLIENILFSGKTYTAPLFVENMEFNSTFVGFDDDVNDGQKRDHYYAHETVLNYWKGNLQEEKMSKNKSFIIKPRKPKSSKVVDYFPYFNEKEILELRINLLKDHVDKFVIVDANKSYTGKEKPFTCKNTLKELGLWDENKIQVIELDLHSDDDEIDFTDTDRHFNHNDPKLMLIGSRERMQRDALLSIVDQFDDDTVFIVSDCDEIINPEHLTYVPNIIRSNPNIIFKIPLVYCEGRADLRLFYESNNSQVQWDCSMFLATKNHLKTHTPNKIRSNFNNPYPISYVGQYDEYGNYVRYEDMGWHFSWMGDIDRKKLKSLSYSHYDHEFEHIIYKKCSGKLMEEFIENHEVTEGNIGVSGFIGTVMKKYPQETLPQIIFDLPRVREFLLPKISPKNEFEELLTNYSLDTENPEHNFQLGLWYEKEGHNSAALSYFLRCAERSEDDTLTYEALIHGSNCYDRQGTRDLTAKGILQQALMVLPNRPEAYFLLSRFSERREYWQDCYIYANNGLSNADFDLEPLREDVEYPGRYGLLYEKSVASWWWGKGEETRQLLQEIEENYEITPEYSENVRNNKTRFNLI
jgi:FkbM family methyltransferase